MKQIIGLASFGRDSFVVKKEHPSTLSRVEGCLCYSRLYSIVVTTRTRLMNGVLASRSSMENCPW